MDNNRNAFEHFFSLEAIAGLLLFIALIVALAINNSALSHWYNYIVDLPIQVRIGALDIDKPFLLWLNDGLMAIFFMLLAMEMKRELIDGELKDFKQTRLPLIGAIGGIVVPALIYYYINRHHPHTMLGWPIPTTTDIAFVLGLMSLLKKRVPTRLRTVMVSLSIVDDVLAITLIAAVFTANLSWLSLALAAVCIVILLCINLAGVTRIAPYILIGVIMWVCVLKSGVHATLAGVIVGLFIPMKGKEVHVSPLKHLEHTLHPWVSFLILPLFVFCNGGLSFMGFHFNQLLQPVALGIILGLVVGKPLGVFVISAIAVKCRAACLPKGVNFKHLLAMSFLCGIGFTMSLFISSLAFNLTPYEDVARQAVLAGSAICGISATLLFLI